MGSDWLLDYCDEVSASDFIWPSQIVADDSSGMLGFDHFSPPDNPCSKKRNHIKLSAAPGTKACREKLRRDKLNNRFIELCSILDAPGPPKADKVVILSDALRRLNQLRNEEQKLKESNTSLRGSIKSLKAEKVEQRDEKARLKAEKERMEQMLKWATLSSAYKAVIYPNYGPVGMWQWMPPAVLDTSQDHVLRPPVA